MKFMVFVFFCSATAALFHAVAQDLNRIELGTHDLAEMKTLSGITIVFDPTKINMMYELPRSASRGDSVTNILGLAGGPQEIDESAERFLERLHLRPYFVALTLPDGAPLWVKASAVSFFRATQRWDNTRSEARSAVNVGGRPIFVKEDVARIKGAIDTMRRRNIGGTPHQ
jgi:hypothetical protein